MIILLGAGGLAREVYHMVYDVSAFVADSCPDPTLLPAPYFTWDAIDEHLAEHRPGRNITFYAAVGDPKIKRLLVEKAIERNWSPGDPVICGTVLGHRSTIIGDGSVIAYGSVLTTNIEIGEHTYININCTVGHDAQIGNYCTVNPGAHISGNTIIGDGALIGTGAIIREGTSVGGGSVVGAQAAVISDVYNNTTVMGVPAKPRS
jgi:sugar O-acyltransferase (sialic acid O-acetyltransferase NeuD family)